MKASNFLLSSSSGYGLFLALNGNICIFAGTSLTGIRLTNDAFWCVGVFSSSPEQLVMQSDGNLVAYSTDGTAYWNSNTRNPTIGKYYVLSMQDDGNLVMYNTQNGTSVWTSGSATTSSTCKSYACVGNKCANFPSLRYVC